MVWQATLQKYKTLQSAVTESFLMRFGRGKAHHP